MTTNISPTSIVVEVLRDDNYGDWSACMKSYMLAHDLWDLIDPANHQEGDSKARRKKNSKARRKKNAAALHAIQISCSPHILSKIRSIISAKDAWDTLANSQQQHSPSHEVQSVESESSESSQGSGPLRNEKNGTFRALYKYAKNGDWDNIQTYLNQHPDGIKAKIKPNGGTALHVAAFAGNLKVMEELVKLMSETELEIQDNFGRTALSCAASVGTTKMAECMVSKNKNLVTFVNKDKWIPLVEACIRNHKDMTLYLYSVTPVDFLCHDNGIHGSLFLQCAIGAQMLDIALDFLHRNPNMTTTKDDVWKSNPLISLSNMPEIFHSGNRLASWQQWIYSCIRIPPIATPDDNFRIYIPDQSLSESKNITLQVSSKLRGFAINLLSVLAKLPPPSQLTRISGAALQMQRELQWYKEVESMMNPMHKKFCYENNLTARELFTNEHKELLVKGEQWMKQAATSCTVVGALIITIMFTAVFTVPGGNVQETGYPVFKDEKSFTVFIVADAISLFSSSISVLMFLGILTSRYAEEDFLKSLPNKLILGLSTLFLSIAAMMVTFCAALIIMLNERLEIIIPVVLLASIPVTYFMLLQFPLLVEIYGSTYGPGIVNKKIKRRY